MPDRHKQQMAELWSHASSHRQALITMQIPQSNEFSFGSHQSLKLQGLSLTYNYHQDPELDRIGIELELDRILFSGKESAFRQDNPGELCEVLCLFPVTPQDSELLKVLSSPQNG